MEYVSVERLMEGKGNSIYKLVIAASRRALELGSGSEKLVDCEPNTKPTSVALKEIKEQKVDYKDIKGK